MCLSLDGNAVSENAINSYAGVTYGWVNTYRPSASYDANTGCWNVYTGGATGFGWAFDASSLSSGLHTFTVKVIDSTGKQSELVSRPITVNNPVPTLKIISPTSGTAVAGTVSIEIEMSSKIGSLIVGLAGASANPVGYFSQASSSAAGIPQGSVLWSAGDKTSFKWTIDTTKLKPEFQTLYISVVDRANQIVSLPLTLDVKSVKPMITILTPGIRQDLKGKITVRAYFVSPSLANRTLAYIGISESEAKPLFDGRASSSSLPSKYSDFSIPSGLTSFDASWTIEYPRKTEGKKEIWVAAQDSEGDFTEVKVEFNIEKSIPVVKILSPSYGQTINGLIQLKVLATADQATTGEITKIAINSQKFSPKFGGQNIGCDVDSTFKCWSVDDFKNYEWVSEPSAFKDGPVTITVIAFDDSDNRTTASVSLTISAVAPLLTIVSPVKTIVSREQFTLTVKAVPNVDSGAEIVMIAISDRTATPQFPGSSASSGTTGLPGTAAIWKISNVKDLSWKIDPTNLSEGDNLINIFVLDSNGKLGQSSIVIHVAPVATWSLMTQGAAVLGQSVAVIVSMATKTAFRLDPQIVATLQTSPSSGGPWTDTGKLTFDASGSAMGRVLVSEKLYVRVNHDQLDAIQAGVSDPLRIVNVPDPKRQSPTSGTGKKNTDGSIPQVVCTAPLTVKIKQKVSIVCSAQDVQDVSQPVQITAQTTSSPKKVGTARIQGGKITGSFIASAKGTFTVLLKGSNAGYVPWTSNPLKIIVK